VDGRDIEEAGIGEVVEVHLDGGAEILGLRDVRVGEIAGVVDDPLTVDLLVADAQCVNETELLACHARLSLNPSDATGRPV
jgi:hypothetical protein